MSAAVGGRDDYDASPLRSLARTSEDLRQARRLLSFACGYDGMSRADTAKGGVGGTGWSAGDDLTFNGGAKTGSVLSLTRGPSPGCLQRPAFSASPGARNTRTRTRASWRLSKRRLPKPCLPFEPRSGRQADRGPGSGRGPHRPEEQPRPHPGVQGDETAMAGRSTKLNRVEKVWQSLRENGLSNRFFEDHADGLAAGCDAWTRLMKEPTAIKSGASREWTQNRQT